MSPNRRANTMELCTDYFWLPLTDPGGVIEGCRGVEGTLSFSENGAKTPGRVRTFQNPRSLRKIILANHSWRATLVKPAEGKMNCPGLQTVPDLTAITK